MALRKRNFNRAGTETRPYPPKITDNRQIFTVFVEATRQLSVVAPKLVKIRIADKLAGIGPKSSNRKYRLSLTLVTSINW